MFIGNQATIEFIRKLPKIGYVNIYNLTDRAIIDNTKGNPQGSIISLNLSNIYLYAFNEYIVKELLPTYNRSKK